MSFKIIKGVKYSKKLLKLADDFKARQKDGCLSHSNATALWSSACEGTGVSLIERTTLHYIQKEYKFTTDGLKFLNDKTSKVVSGKSYYKIVAGVRYDRGLLDEASTLAKDGSIDISDVRQLWNSAMDGPGITKIERRSLIYIMELQTFTPAAEKLLKEKLQEKKPTVIKEIEDQLVDYEENTEMDVDKRGSKVKEIKKGSYAGIHSSGFRDFLLKSELLTAISDCGFEHPSEVQQECIPQAILGMDIICQAKSGMGKTAVFVLAVLHQLEPKDDQTDTLVVCHTRELAYQICQEFLRFSKYLKNIKIKVFFGGIPIRQHRKLLDEDTPHVIIGTPGRTLQLCKEKKIKLGNLKRFVLDECDQMLEQLDMRRDIQQIFKLTPHEKQVMMFSATLAKEIRPVAKKFTQNPIEIYVDNESKLTLHGLQQYFIKLEEKQKNRKLNDLLDALEFNQVVVFVNGVRRCKELNALLQECNFPSMCMYGGLRQEERLERYNQFKEFKCRILVSTDIFGRGVDFERINIVINYDMPKVADMYLHRVGRSGRFGTKGLAVSFISSNDDDTIMGQVQSRFEVEVAELPDTIDTSSYMNA